MAKIFLGNIVHCKTSYSTESFKGFLIIRDKQIIAIDLLSKLEEEKQRLNVKNAEEIKLTGSQILIPGLIDTHLHAPQYPNSGLGYDKPLLEWLDWYTYPTESKYNDLVFSKRVYDAVVKKTLSCGTTTVCYFASMFGDSSLVLVDSAIQYGQRALVGAINMIKLAPENYIETREESIRKTKSFVEAVFAKNSDLVVPVITPRFALSVDVDLMKELAVIAQEHDLHIQSHISENVDEVDLVISTFGCDYATAYDKGQLLTPKTIMAHGVYLTDTEIELLRNRGTSIAHCPTSNTLLRSGMCHVTKLIKSGLNVGLGTDVSGGASPSIIEVMRAAYDTSVHLGFGKKNETPFSYQDVFCLATLGGAKALSLDHKIGNFEVGKEFDALIVDMDVENSSADYLEPCTSLELLQKFIFLGDDRNVIKVYVAGKLVK